MGDFAMVTGNIYLDENGIPACEIFQTLIDENVEHSEFDGINESLLLDHINFPSDLHGDYFFAVLIKVQFEKYSNYNFDIYNCEPEVKYEIREINSPKNSLTLYGELA